VTEKPGFLKKQGFLNREEQRRSLQDFQQFQELTAKCQKKFRCDAPERMQSEVLMQDTQQQNLSATAWQNSTDSELKGLVVRSD